MDKLELLRLAEMQDVESFNEEDFEVGEKDINKFRNEYNDFYNDVKQANKYIKEDW